MEKKDNYNDFIVYGYDLNSDLLESSHYLRTIEDILGKPIRKKIKRINDKEFSIHLSNGEFILATKKGKSHKSWIFNYKDTEKDTRILNPDYKYETALRRDFFKNKDNFQYLLQTYIPKFRSIAFMSARQYDEQKETEKELLILWKKLTKKQKGLYKYDSKLVNLIPII